MANMPLPYCNKNYPVAPVLASDGATGLMCSFLFTMQV